jgi:hypothetical protein
MTIQALWETAMSIVSAKRVALAALGFGVIGALVETPVGAQNSASIPELSGHWSRTNFNLEQPDSGPKFITNTLKKPDGTIDDDTGRVGDYTNPLLTQEASKILREHGELSRTGKAISDPHNQCWPEAPPFTLSIQVEFRLLQRKDEVVLVYVNGQNVRHIRMNAQHPTHPKPTLLGDSIGHYEGDTLVIDTVAIKPSPWPVIDRYGTPHSDALHVVERYRLIGGEEAAAAMRKHRRQFTTADAIPRFGIYGAEFDTDLSKKGLQVEVTVEDRKMFTAPWKGLLTYRPATGWPEMTCAESLTQSAGVESKLPVANKPDF